MKNKIKVLENHCDLWLWLFYNPEKDNNDYFRKHNLEFIESNDFLCEEKVKNEEIWSECSPQNKKCILYGMFGGSGEDCCRGNTHYRGWVESANLEVRRKYAHKMFNIGRDKIKELKRGDKK